MEGQMPTRPNDFRYLAVVVAAMVILPPASADASIVELYQQSAGSDLTRVGTQVVELSGLAQKHIQEVGLAQAMLDFAAAPWRRHANGLHLWGVTISGMSWFDAGHPDLVGLDVSGMTDIEGRNWWQLAVDSANGSGAATFEILYPHPDTGRAARGLHTCFLLEDQQRVLCAGAFVDPD
jgi:hypothetical protein